MITCEFDKSIEMDQIEDALALAVAAGESLHGSAAVRLGAGISLDRTRRTCRIDTDTPAGDAIARVFVGYAERCFGPGSFSVRARTSELTAA